MHEVDQLTHIGVSAVHVTASMHVDNFASEKYRFWMWNMPEVLMIYACNCTLSCQFSCSLRCHFHFQLTVVFNTICELALVAIDEAHCITDW